MKKETGTLPSCDGIHTLHWFGCVPEQLWDSIIRNGDIFVIKTVDPLPERRLSIVRNESVSNNSAAILEDYIIKHSVLRGEGAV